MGEESLIGSCHFYLMPTWEASHLIRHFQTRRSLGLYFKLMNMKDENNNTYNVELL